jgi:indolepyruvate ferredoxin oxidoreductase alpha subunit
MESALGMSFAGKRSLVTMKHVGLNVAADPFINGALLGIKGGLVIMVADDPGMHSSQGEQDSRYYAAFASPPLGIPCFEPRNQEEAYNMAREAFDVSEYFKMPVLFRLTTRLSHARSQVTTRKAISQKPLDKAADRSEWMLLPAMARKNYAGKLAKADALERWASEHPVNRLKISGNTQEDSAVIDKSFAVISGGLGGNYYEENLDDLKAKLEGKIPARLHIGVYPLPKDLILSLAKDAKTILVIEEGQPYIEEKIKGILPTGIVVRGKLDGSLPRTGELDADVVRPALDLAARKSILATSGANSLNDLLCKVPGRPPQLCQGCPHADSYNTIKQVRDEILAEAAAKNVPEEKRKDLIALCSDIGCYSLGASPPFQVPETIVCMGASIGMAHGAADAGVPYSIGIIGDSTFLHSGITGLVDAVAGNTPMTIIILDNSIVAMTGCQETIIPSSALKPLILGAGLYPAHYVELEAKKQLQDENAKKLRTELEYRGLSVIVFKRECLEAFRKRNKK